MLTSQVKGPWSWITDSGLKYGQPQSRIFCISAMGICCSSNSISCHQHVPWSVTPQGLLGGTLNIWPVIWWSGPGPCWPTHPTLVFTNLGRGRQCCHVPLLSWDSASPIAHFLSFGGRAWRNFPRSIVLSTKPLQWASTFQMKFHFRKTETSMDVLLAQSKLMRAPYKVPGFPIFELISHTVPGDFTLSITLKSVWLRSILASIGSYN